MNVFIHLLIKKMKKLFEDYGKETENSSDVPQVSWWDV